MKIVIGADHAGVHLKDGIIKLVESLGHEVTDVGCNCSDSVDYPDYAIQVCDRVVAGTADRGILICGTGIGMTIAANKIPGIRCALVHDLFSAQMTRQHNDSNVLAMGERIIGPGLAEEIVKVWLETEFSGGERHVNRISKVKDIENQSNVVSS
ncbi:ribose 5-phosphate isomerase B [Paenibacillus agricola]|uniref:Ribose 5-phosphate isomerase B n=1 Tax=Paenibacillus agricola TaxID=2716264 RepID=A0ABX0JHI5_9BACL|nr:ribose 5-phosphate isomerase B [Paenibacillus agricola]NHN33804.1 ribose 5-phosphate isomerase B [Paenibacillus agricola]